MSQLTCSVLIPSFGRIEALRRCFFALAGQTLLPTEVIIAWQGDDEETQQTAKHLADEVVFPVVIVHCAEASIVAAENAALAQASGEVILMLDDDAVPSAEWVARHVAHYRDASIGAVGGCYVNFHATGEQFPERRPRVIGKINWCGKFTGNMFDHPSEWAARAPIDVEHLAGNNMSIRRCAFDEFNSDLRSYWQFFEADACLKVKSNGFRILFDFSNSVLHYPTSLAHDSRDRRNLLVKVFNPAYNHSLIMALYSPWHLWVPRLLYPFLVGSRNTPGMLGYFFAIWKFGKPGQELGILANTLKSNLGGWITGTASRLCEAPPKASQRPLLKKSQNSGPEQINRRT